MIYLNALGRQAGISAAANSWISGGAGAETQRGTDRHDAFHGLGGDTLIGGLGDDGYTLWTSSEIVELAGEGIDTATSYVSGVTRLSAYVENLTLMGDYSWLGIGNGLGNLLIAGDGGKQLDGAAGDDVLVGGAGADVFIVKAGEGSDAIYGFQAGSDKLRLAGFGLSTPAEVKAVMVQDGADVRLDLAGGQDVILRDVTIGQLSGDNFQLGIDVDRLAVTLSDNFDSLSLISNGGIWRTDYGFGGNYEHGLIDEQQAYVDASYGGTSSSPLGIDPFAIQNGVLSITAAPSGHNAAFLSGRIYTSGLLSSINSFSQQYGYFEIRAAMPVGQGFHPAFWMMPADGSWPPELDIVETLGRDPGMVYMTAHSAASGSHTKSSRIGYTDNVTEMHTYGLDWSKDALVWYVDGVEVARAATSSDMHKEFYVIANLAVGSDWAGKVDATTGTGVMSIDYIRAYATDATVSYTRNGVQTVVTAPQARHELGTPGNDTLSGSLAADTLEGGDGNDVYAVNDSGDRVVEWVNGGKGGWDRVNASVSYTLDINIEELRLTGLGDLNGTGNYSNNFLFGNDGSNRLNGGIGNDKLWGNGGLDTLDGGTGLDTLEGGDGNDTYLVDNNGDRVIEWARSTGGSSDAVRAWVSYALAANIEELRLQGAGNLNGTGNVSANIITGTEGANALQGLAGNDMIWGNAGADRLDGGTGADRLEGGDGNDIYYVDNTGDQIIEWWHGGAGGQDLVIATVSQVLGELVENLTLTGTGSVSGVGNSQANVLIGNSGDNRLAGLAGHDRIRGDAGADVLDGGAGADTLDGGVGNDSFHVDSSSDLVIEGVGGGHDVVYASGSFTLGANIEELRISGPGSIKGVGNAADNLITSNGGVNLLMGAGGNDHMRAHGGADTLDGGTGADTLEGGSGDDRYLVDNAGDLVIEWEQGGLGGVDIVTASLSYTLPRSAERLTLSGAGALDGTGNGGGNVITGGAGGNRLSGLDGNDVLLGNGGADTLDGGAGADTLRGDTGDDMLTGGAGGDRFVFAAGSGADLITDCARGDIIDVSGWLAGGQPAASVAFADGAGGARISLSSGETITLAGVGSAALAIDNAGIIYFA